MLDVVNFECIGKIWTKFIILSGNEILMLFKGRNFVTNKQKLTHNNPKLDVVNIYEYAKFAFIRSLDIERKQNSDIIQGP